MTIMIKSRVDYIQEVLAVILSKIFCLLVSYQKTYILKYAKL